MFRTNTDIMGQRSTFVIEVPDTETEEMRDKYVFSAETVQNSNNIYHTIDRDPHIIAIRTSKNPKVLYTDSHAYQECVINTEINWRSQKEQLLYVENVKIGNNPSLVRCEGYIEDWFDIGNAQEAKVIIEGENTTVGIEYEDGYGWSIKNQGNVQSETFGVNNEISNTFSEISELIRLEFSEFDDITGIEVRYPS